MKIALISAYDLSSPGGVAIHVSQMADRFSALGHTVKILAPYPRSIPATPDERLVPLGRPIPIPSGGSIARISLSIWLMPRIRKYLAQEGFDVVHVHEPLAPVLPLCALEVSRAVNVGTFHAFSDNDRYRHLLRPLVRRWFDRLHGRVACSPASLEYARRFFPGDYRLIPDGVDLSRFSPQVSPLPELEDGNLNILFVGRLEKRKGLRFLLKAYSELCTRFPRMRLVVVGPGALDKYSSRLLAEPELRARVVLAGRVASDVLPRYYRSAHIFCAPATGNEALGIVLLEAMASARPIVATSRGADHLGQSAQDGHDFCVRGAEVWGPFVLSFLDETMR